MPRRFSGAHSRQEHPDARLRAETTTVQVGQPGYSWQEYEHSRVTRSSLPSLLPWPISTTALSPLQFVGPRPEGGAGVRWQWDGTVARAKRIRQ